MKLVFNHLKKSAKEVKKELKREFEGEQFSKIEDFLKKEFLTSEVAYDSTSGYACYWYTGNHKKNKFIEKYLYFVMPNRERLKFVGITANLKNELIAFYENENEEEYFFEILEEVSSFKACSITE